MNTTPGKGSRVIASRNLFSYFLFLLLVLALWLAYQLVESFLHTLILGAVFSAICYPLYLRCKPLVRGNSILSALLVLTGLVVCIVIPVCVFVALLIPQGMQTVTAINKWLSGGGPAALLSESNLEPWLAWVRVNLPFIDLSHIDFQTSMLQLSRTAGQTLIQWGSYVLGNTMLFFLHFLLLLLVMFFMLKDGRRMVEGVKYLCPLREEQEDMIIQSLRRVARAVLVGGLLVAVVQGVLGGIGMAIVGMPGLFWGTVMGFASLVPVVGTGLVWGPASVYLLLMGQWKGAVFLALWCSLVVAGADSILRPYFMRGSSGTSVFYIFLSILGGLKTFGMAGIIYGPLILSFTMVMLTLYGEEYRDILAPRAADPANCPPCPPRAEAAAENTARDAAKAPPGTGGDV
ncbi:AI-2E family transporter [Nitratidesulfovibrio sp. 1201_IL3209]|uniref:AI-2E family transporter n=1 Tax=Nitratidesulfovibrio sp. 1201_IL3209 TaxID=3084053 RepID=UPI002FDA58BE